MGVLSVADLTPARCRRRLAWLRVDLDENADAGASGHGAGMTTVDGRTAERKIRVKRWLVFASLPALIGAAIVLIAKLPRRPPPRLYDSDHSDESGVLTEFLSTKAWVTEGGTCADHFVKPPQPSTFDEHNGIALQDVCLTGDGPFHAFIIGDWGSLDHHGWIHAAPNFVHRAERGEGIVGGLDTTPQQRVRDQIKRRAPDSNPDYFLNVGDSFYWGGVLDTCGAKDFTKPYANGGTPTYKGNGYRNQFHVLYEDFYKGPGIDGKPWLGILGNHDYGGYLMNSAWDQLIGYTWTPGTTGRWMMPALYYRVTVRYPDFSVDYYFIDTNVWDANDPHNPSTHNICSMMHNGWNARCGGGLDSIWKCPHWFRDLWDKQKQWLDSVVPKSTADWRIVVTHFPPYFGKEEWQDLARKHKIDLMITGHRHSQHVRNVGDKPKLIWPDWGAAAWKEGFTDFLDPTAWVVSGGGGGIASEHAPRWDGKDDQYGFMDLTLSKDNLTVEAISHAGALRHTMVVEHHYCSNKKKSHGTSANASASESYTSAGPHLFNGNASSKIVVSPSAISCPMRGMRFTADVTPMIDNTTHMWILSYGPYYNGGFSVGIDGTELRVSVLHHTFVNGSIASGRTSTVGVEWDGKVVTASIDGTIVIQVEAPAIVWCQDALWIGGEQYQGGRWWFKGQMENIELTQFDPVATTDEQDHDAEFVRLLPMGAHSCPEGDAIRNMCECKEAITSLEIDGLSDMWVGVTDTAPVGCSVRVEGKDRRPHFNLGRKGGGRHDLSPVCRNSTLVVSSAES